MRKFLIVTAAAAAMVASAALAQMAPTKIGDSAKGKVLTNDAGMTLYTFDKDPAANRHATVAAPAIGRH